MQLTCEIVLERLNELLEKGWGELRVVVNDGKIVSLAKTETEISQKT